MGVRKRGGARRGRGVFPAVRVWDQQHGRGWRRAGSGCAARTNRGSERHGALPGGSQGAPGRARPCSQPGSGAGAAPAARGGAWTPPRRTETSPGAARPRCSPGRTRSAAPNTAGPPRSHAGPAARGSAASPAGPDSLPTRGPLRSHPPPPAPAPRRPGAQKFPSARAATLPGQSWAGMVAAALAALGPAALSRPAEEMGSSGASPPGPAALPGTARRTAPAPCRHRPPAGEGRRGRDRARREPRTPARTGGSLSQGRAP